MNEIPIWVAILSGVSIGLGVIAICLLVYCIIQTYKDK